MSSCTPCLDQPGCRLPGALGLGRVWCPPAPAEARGISSWRVSPYRRAHPRAACCWSPVTVRFGRGAPPSVCPGVQTARGGLGGWEGEHRLRGSVPVRGALLVPGPCPPSLLAVQGPSPLGAGSSPWPSPRVPPATRVAGFALRSAVGGGGRQGGWARSTWAWCSWALGAAARASCQ